MKLVTTHPLTIALACASIAAIGIVAHAIERPAATQPVCQPHVIHAVALEPIPPPTVPAPAVEPDPQVMPAPAE